jgi:hypothetical protein
MGKANFRPPRELIVSLSVTSQSYTCGKATRVEIVDLVLLGSSLANPPSERGKGRGRSL